MDKDDEVEHASLLPELQWGVPSVNEVLFALIPNTKIGTHRYVSILSVPWRLPNHGTETNLLFPSHNSSDLGSIHTETISLPGSTAPNSVDWHPSSFNSADPTSSPHRLSENDGIIHGGKCERDKCLDFEDEQWGCRNRTIPISVNLSMGQ